jgi:hypothetical protein
MSIQISSYLKENDYIERTIREQQITMFIVKGIPENAYFETQTRKEIGVRFYSFYISTTPYSYVFIRILGGLISKNFPWVRKQAPPRPSFTWSLPFWVT